MHDLELTEDQRMIRDMARDFARREIAPHAQAWERAGWIDDALVTQMGELGLLGDLLRVSCFDFGQVPRGLRHLLRQRFRCTALRLQLPDLLFDLRHPWPQCLLRLGLGKLPVALRELLLYRRFDRRFGRLGLWCASRRARRGSTRSRP